MQLWPDLVVFNAVSATLLALVVAIVAVRTRRPSLLHLLWLVVLVKLVSPPAAEVALVPRLEALREFVAFRGSTPESTPPVPEHAGHEGPDRAAILSPQSDPSLEPSRASTFPLGWLPWILSIVGSCALMSFGIVRTWQLHNRVQAAPEAPEEVRQRVAALATRFGIARAPRVRWVTGHLSPAVWLSRGQAEILFPADLWPCLSRPEGDALLAHELAHVRRRDAYVRMLELLVVALYWWHPVAWWARRRLRAAEEEACDAMVLATVPHSTRSYAEGLLKTVEFLAHGGTRATALTTANDVSTRLQERLIMILTVKPRAPLSLRVRVGVLGLVLGAILVSPAWMDTPIALTEESPRPEVRFAREQLALEKELHEIELRRMKVQYELEATQTTQHAEQLRQMLKTLETENRPEEAKAVRADLARLEREQVERREHLEAEHRYEAARSDLDFKLRELSIQRDALQAAGREDAAKKVLGQMQELESQMRDLQLQAQRAEIEQARKQLARETADLENLRTGP